MQFGSGGTSIFTTAPTAGSPTLAVGTGSFSGGGTPAFQGTAAIGVNMAAGYSNDLINLQVAGIPWFKVSSSAVYIPPTIPFGAGGGIPQVFMGTGDLRFGPGGTTQSVYVLTPASQTADSFKTVDSGSVTQFGIANIGTGPAPIWALRVAPVANAASMAQAHVGGASTGKAIQVIDNAGTTIGWLQLLA